MTAELVLGLYWSTFGHTTCQTCINEMHSLVGHNIFPECYDSQKTIHLLLLCLPFVYVWHS